ncbi:hypothetical protein CEXT_238791 [Caerostris extrusa]|uniref:Uncharacterized protein n=1 Tax=Caerostris extrusa TaxID=172846 RepID=A0AAV4PND7_CAEEX|nr:hypothetical protein CEXT_238791 [Caerostris extrusa]
MASKCLSAVISRKYKTLLETEGMKSFIRYCKDLREEFEYSNKDDIRIADADFSILNSAEVISMINSLGNADYDDFPLTDLETRLLLSNFYGHPDFNMSTEVLIDCDEEMYEQIELNEILDIFEVFEDMSFKQELVNRTEEKCLICRTFCFKYALLFVELYEK